MEKIGQAVRYDISHPAATISAAANTTGKYYKLDEYRKACFVFCINASVAATGILTGQIKQAVNVAGGSVKSVSGAVQTITANAKAKKVTVTASTILTGDAITINGLTFTGHTNTAVVATRQYSIASSDTNAMAALAVAINEAIYGVPGVTATSNAAVLTLVANDDYQITITAAATTLTPATIVAIASVEVDVSQLDLAGGFYWVALDLAATTINSPCGAIVILGDPRYSPTQVDA